MKKKSFSIGQLLDDAMDMYCESYLRSHNF